MVTERIIRAGGGQPLTKTIIPLPSLPSQSGPASSWTTVDIDIDAADQPTVEVHHVKIRPSAHCLELGLELEGGRREGIFISEIQPGGLAAGLTYPGLQQGPVTPTQAHHHTGDCETGAVAANMTGRFFSLFQNKPFLVSLY